jgi:hypothetical protein
VILLGTGYCRGRRVLGFYNVIIIGVIVAFLFAVLAIRAIVSNFKYVQVGTQPLRHP